MTVATMPKTSVRNKPKTSGFNWTRMLCGFLGGIWFAATVVSWQSKPNADIVPKTISA
tara:strand:- start:49 stop:222 length:174 start_codon:yes stop_codon:yes gene_type:complete